MEMRGNVMEMHGEIGCLHGVRRGACCNACEAEDRAAWRRVGFQIEMPSGRLVPLPYTDQELTERTSQTLR